MIERVGPDVEFEEVVFGQRVFPKVVTPFLRDLKFASDDQIAEWWRIRKTLSSVRFFFDNNISPKIAGRAKVGDSFQIPVRGAIERP
jgi:hypothetical protein